ncbi:MAG TPA: T9SS type A sorting domain-containing protein [bacterium]|nr:T9SS type A sorting domain-containing protein [bacterium]
MTLIRTKFSVHAAGALLASILVCASHAFALGGSGVTACNSSAPTPVAAESLTQFNTITGIGLNYTLVQTTAGKNFTVALPAGAVIVQAYFWLVEDENTATPVTTATFNGTGVTATNATTSFLWSPLWYTNLRFDVTALVTATGTSYSWASGSVSSIGVAQSGYLAIVYQLASDTTETTLVFADGMNVWHDNETTEDGPGPEPVNLNWNCADNPVCNVSDVSFSRAGGNIYNVDDGDVADGKYADEILNPSTHAILWTGPTGQLPICGGEPCPQVSSYSPGSPAFSVGQDATEYDLYNNTTYAAKDTVFLASLVLMNKCPNPQSPTNTPMVSATPSPTRTPVVTETPTNTSAPTPCGPGPSLDTGTEWNGNGGGTDTFSGTVTGPATLPTDPLFLVRVYVGGSTGAPAGILTSVTYGGVPLQVYYTGQTAIGGSTSNTDFETWYLTGASIPTGTKTLVFNWNNGVYYDPIWFSAEFFENVNQSNPLGATSDNIVQSGGTSYVSSLTSSQTGSLVSSILTDGEDNSNPTVSISGSSPGGAATEFSAPGADDFWGSDVIQPTANTATTITHSMSSNADYWSSENIEILAPPCVPSPTPTNTPSKTFTPTSTPTNSFTASPTNTFTPSPTNTFTASPTKTFTVSPTNSFTVSPTSTFSVSPTNTFTPSPTNSFTVSPTESFTPSPTNSFTASPTRTYTASPTATFTVSPTSTFTASPTNSFTVSPTKTYTVSPTDSFTPSPTNTFTVSPTRTYTVSPTDTFTVSPTNTFSVSPTNTFTASPTRTFTASPTNSFTASPTESFTQSPTNTFTASPTRTFTASPSVTVTETSTLPPTGTVTNTYTFTVSPTNSFTVSPTRTFTVSPTNTFSFSPTNTFTDSPTESFTQSPTNTFTASPTLTFTASPTRTFTASPSVTVTETSTLPPTGTVTNTYTFTVSPTNSFTASPTRTFTVSPTSSFTTSPTQTFTASPTDTFSFSPTETFTASPTASFTPSPSGTFTASPTQTSTVSPTRTFTASPSVTVTETSTLPSTGTVTNTYTFTVSPTDSFTASPTRSFTVSPTDSFTASPTETSTASPTESFTPSPTESFTASPSQTSTVSPTRTFTASPSVSVTETSTLPSTGTVTNTYTFTESPTETATASPTPTFSASPTNTFSFSPSGTFTASPTDSFTPSPTESFTASPTLSSTASPTETFTKLPTGSATDTSSSTASPTESSTLSATPTSTSSPTQTQTLSPTGTPTLGASPTDSFTASPTRTSTQSPTDTFTPSSTGTASATPSFTLSATETFTPSPPDSATDSPTGTASFTASPTRTWSETATQTPTASDSATETSSPSDTPSYTSTATDSPQNTSTDTATDSPSPSSTPTHTPTSSSTLSSSPSRTDTPTDTVTASPTASPSSTRSPTATWSPTRTASPTMTLTLTVTQTFTASATPVPEPYQVVVNIYNSAGELVRSLYNGTSEYSADQAQVLETVSPTGAVQVDIAGLDGNAGSNLEWNANNNSGQSVQSGVYTVVITSKNSFGQIQTQTKAVSVLAVGGQATLNIYNSAGELVANLSGALANDTSAPISMSLELPSGQNGMVASTNPNSKQGLVIKLTFADGNTLDVPWTGLNSQGQPLQPGNYLATLSMAEPGASKVVQTQPFVLLNAPDFGAAGMAQSAVAAPNPVQGGSFTVQYQPDGVDSAVATLYDLAGQLVCVGMSSGPNTLSFSGKWSAGVYLLDFEVRDGGSGILARKVIKVAVVR